MVDNRYRMDEGYAAHINAELVSAARDFLADKVGVIATARILKPHLHALEDYRPDLAKTTRMVVAIDSETDALPIGNVREMWHPSTAAIEDAKAKHSEELCRQDISAVCRELVRVLG
jgi:hypothetical protein